MAFDTFREPQYPMSEAIATRHVTEMMMRQLRELQRSLVRSADRRWAGTYCCPYCYRDKPHSDEEHDGDRDKLEKVLHSEAQPLCDDAKVWARERLDKLHHAPRRADSASPEQT